MKVYRIIFDQNNDHKASDLQGFQVVNIYANENNRNPKLRVDNELMSLKYGFQMSGFEIDLFCSHYAVWEQFRIDEDQYCLVIEDTTKLSLPFEQNIDKLKNLFDKYESWDIFFPFDPTTLNSSREREPGYLLGFRWGTGVYFINKKKLDVLLSIDVIKQELSDEILSLSSQNGLDIYYEETAIFNLGTGELHKKHRRNAIKSAIFNSDAWTTQTKIEIRLLLNEISHLAFEADINIILSDGTLLGHIRHGEIMPWDDDVDLGLKESSYGVLKALLDNSQLVCQICHYGPDNTPYCKVWMASGRNIDGWSHKFPFVDIWFFNEVGNQIIYNHGTSYPLESYYPLKSAVFEQSNFMIPAEPLKCLDINYADWRNKIRVFSYSHQLEKVAFVPLSINIDVDDFGRLIDN